MSESSSFIGQLKQFDAYSKPLDDFRVKTLFGGSVTVISAIIMFILFISELSYFVTLDVHSELIVDNSRDSRIGIYFNIMFYKMACAYLTLDAMDVSGETQSNILHSVYRRRLDLDGKVIDYVGERHEVNENQNATKLDPKRCESCYGAESAVYKCCNTCDDVREAYRLKGWALADAASVDQCKREGVLEKVKEQVNEGCEIYGHIEVNKVAGNFHIAPGKTFKHAHSHVHDMQELSGLTFNSSHLIRHLAFGSYYPGMKNPLDMTSRTDDVNGKMFHYYVKIVPTLYQHVDKPNEPITTNQYSATWHSKPTQSGIFSDGLPGIFVSYEFSPMMVKYVERRRSFTHFVTSVCAIVGGVFTVAGLLDSLIYRSSKLIKEKMEIGKLT